MIQNKKNLKPYTKLQFMFQFPISVHIPWLTNKILLTSIFACIAKYDISIYLIFVLNKMIRQDFYELEYKKIRITN